MMPKGVDHTIWDAVVKKFALVQKSLMPKGVDHLHDVWFFWICLACKNL